MTLKDAEYGSAAMFDRIARRYDILNRILSWGADREWRGRVVQALHIEGEKTVLDVATGTADVAIAVARGCPGARVVGLDPSPRMLAVGQVKCVRARVADRVTLHRGDAYDLPFRDRVFDAVTIAFGIRNVPDRARALREMARVTRPGGRVVLLELTEPRDGPFAFLPRFYVAHVLPVLGRYLSSAPEYGYLSRSIARFPAPQAFRAEVEAAGLAVLGVDRLGWGACHLFVCRRPDPTAS